MAHVRTGIPAQTETANRKTLILDGKRVDGRPAAQGLYDPANEHDACGIGMIANIKNKPSHEVVQKGLEILENLEHRGAVGADPLMGDGAGILVQTPHAFFAKVLPFALPEKHHYAVAMVFYPNEAGLRDRCAGVVRHCLEQEGLELLGERVVPTDNSRLSEGVIATQPIIEQMVIARPEGLSLDEFERKLLIVRKVISNTVYAQVPESNSDNGFYVVSMSARTLVYKGMFLAYQLGAFYTDLHDEAFESAIALVHQRFSTNTFPSWKLAHPYRMTTHNGEINTIRGNVNWMAARQASVSSPKFGDDITKIWPISYEGQSDTACFDNALEFLVRGGYSLPHAAMMLIPEAWAGNPLMDEERRAFYEYHAALMEPWDGPAAMSLSDGRYVVATLDRNGLRPARYLVTKEGHVVLASESGVLDIPDEDIVERWRLQPGRMLLIDLEEGRIISDEEVKKALANKNPYAEWLARSQIVLEDLPATERQAPKSSEGLLDRLQAFGYTQEDIKLLMAPMATTGQEAVGSMGTDTPISALSNKSKLLYTYFKQNFAQVTNPPIDPIREESVMSLVSFIGPRPNILDLEGSSREKRLEVRQPILTNEDLEKIRAIGDMRDNQFKTKTIDITYMADKGAAGMEAALEDICAIAEDAVRGEYNIIVLSDRLVAADRIAIPALLATAAVHHHLIRKGLRTSSGLVIETGEAREMHHFAMLAGYGAEAINPYLAFEVLAALHAEGEYPPEVSADEVVYRYIKSVGKGLLKVMSKMGISTYQSYCGAQIFDAIGLNTDFVKKYFFGTATSIEGVGLAEVSEETVRRHHDAFGDDAVLRKALDIGGEYAYRIRGEKHAWSPDVVADLQHAVRTAEESPETAQERYDSFARRVNEGENGYLAIRHLFDIKPIGPAVNLDQVEPAVDIVRRFVTGAMSFGSISREAHTTLAIAMNKIGGKSNTGEGGEEPDRYKPLPDGSSNPLRSAIKQVASGRFGVTTEYLVNSDQIQIKVAQGAKPGEGGQLPGHKVDWIVAKTRHSTPGVGLISPPPHHDIYSIEDLAQLIYDLKNVNEAADISVKLVSEVGVGTVAAGVAKARADHITISGYDGGTGASPLTSLKHAGGPWEIGLAETHQTLVLNRLRSRVRLQVDGGLKTGRDVLVGALLGADEFGFSTAPLIAAGCIMMRKCHLNTCPVGVATQDPVLRKRFKGTPEHVINYFFYVAEELRALLASLGATTLNELIGRSDLLDQRRAENHWKSEGIDLAKVFYKPAPLGGDTLFHSEVQNHHLEAVLDRKLIELAAPALDNGAPVQIELPIRSRDRSAGAMLSGALAKKYGHAGLPEDTISITLKGTAGQAFGAFLAKGISIDMIGDANDYVGKGLSGGRIVVRPSDKIGIVPENSIIVGNTVLYGAVAGECYFRGVAGERFAVRNSGAIAVVEGTGDHGCEYMTGGLVVVIGKTGRNFAAGMSGGVAYVLDEDETFRSRCNLAMVDLEPVQEEEDLMRKLHHHGGDLEWHGRVDISGDMTKHDDERLHQLISNHLHYTGSTRAKQILDNWAEMRPKFVKVMPVEYRRAILEMEKKRGSGAHVAAE
ncbi:glutamate synthase large subunit [Devosia sp. XJ19-1]|uniref:Glutamate synthase [NADPH] large chain n=1 Tax=Devosia ureilytica TaxID=2952754 RepID=A0A9Q4ARM6_9HYPH|nr:glutamate synthase large subunit [Devosia ureilytica]MCP8884776.1 glutamate synthase large subunit [Devosia ureilytica]MCP8888407.1 glutamate synthase large subunit [Devosia ureilytica]